jgi:sodium-dependent dicarboxylate transporter 2/3/5
MKGFCLSIAYAASTGGAGTLVGTAPNLVLKGFVEANYPNSKLSFLTYMAYSLPVAFVMITLSWVSLILLWLPRKYNLVEILVIIFITEKKFLFE